MAVSSIAPGTQVMTTTYTFMAQTGALGPLRFLQYLDEDVQGNLDDVFFTMGSAGSGNLQLFTFDNTDQYGLSHSGALLPATGLQNASFAGWAADVFPNMRPRITNGPGQPVSPTGMNNLEVLGLGFQHPQLGPVFGPADIVSVLAWDADPSAASAVITTSLGGIPISTGTVEAQPVVGTPTRCTGKRCMVAVTCVLPPGQSCTNSIALTVSRNALRTSEGTSVKQGRRTFAAGIANVPGGQIGTVRLGLTPRARRFVRSTMKRRLPGRLEIRNIIGTTVSSTPMRILIRR